MYPQAISNVAEILSQKGINHVVISPGSRSAPLTIAFARHPKIKTYVISDERSAGFVALGISQNLKEPVGVVCTSGTAAANLFPSVAEAFFQDTPLIVMTADRPPEWIDQWDGQTIFQENIYGSHVKKSFMLSADVHTEESKVQLYKQVFEGLDIATSLPKGPVHFNFPFREPFYPQKGEELQYENIPNLIEKSNQRFELNKEVTEDLISTWKSSSKRMVMVGQSDYSKEFHSLLENLSRDQSIPLVGDILSNFHNCKDAIRYSDIIFNSIDGEKRNALAPELLITFGKSIISKNLKLFLRAGHIKHHWHIQFGDKIRDPFKSVTRILNIHPENFVSKLIDSPPEDEFVKQKQTNFLTLWQGAEHKAEAFKTSFLEAIDFGEWKATSKIMGSLPQDSILHLANSMPVRLANLCGLKDYQQISVCSNRGTSGIDGCTSTSMGFAFTSKKPVVLITGDMAFLYDRNAFWHNYPYDRLRIVVLNNHGGGIFRLISGPSDQPELEEYFETQQKFGAESAAREFDIDYYFANSEEQLEAVWADFFSFDGKPKLLEIESKPEINQEIFKRYRLKTESLL